MRKELEFADVFLRLAHPEKRGWEMTRGLKVAGLTLDYVFHKEQAYTLVVLRMGGPFVSKADVDMALRAQKVCTERFNASRVRVFMVYGRLLHPAERLPKGISVMSVTEDDDGGQGERLYDVCPN